MNRPWFIFELTPFCNYACPYCYCGSPKSSGSPGDLPGIMDFCFAASVNRLCLAQFVPIGAGAENRQELQIDAFGFKKVLAAANRFSGEYGLPIHIGVPVKPCCIDHKQYPSLVFEACMCGVDKWAIDPKGNLKTCELNREICGNLFERSFEELSGTKTAMEFRENNYGSDCPACEHWERCGGGCRFMPTA